MKMWIWGEKQEGSEKLRGSVEKMEQGVEKHSEGRNNVWRKNGGRDYSQRSQKTYIRTLKRSRSKIWMDEKRWTKRARGKSFSRSDSRALIRLHTFQNRNMGPSPAKLGFHCQQNCFHSWDCSASECLQSAHPGALWYRLHQTQPIKAMGIILRARNWAPAWLPLCRNENVSSQKKTHLRYNSTKIRNRPFDSRHAKKSSSWYKNELSCRRGQGLWVLL